MGVWVYECMRQQRVCTHGQRAVVAVGMVSTCGMATRRRTTERDTCPQQLWVCVEDRILMHALTAAVI